MICPGDKFLLSQLKLAKTFIITKAEICCTWSGNWSEAAEDNVITLTHVTTTKNCKYKDISFYFLQPTHDEVTSAFLPSHRVFDAGPEGLRGTWVIILLIISPHFTWHGPPSVAHNIVNTSHFLPFLSLLCSRRLVSDWVLLCRSWRLEWEEEDGGDSRLGQGRMRQGGRLITWCT